MGIFSEKLRPEQDLSNDVDSVFNDYMFKDVEFKDMQGNTHTGTVSAVHFATDEYDDDYLVIYSDEGNEVLKRPKDVKLIETLEECFNDTLIGPQKQNEELFEGFNYSDGPDDDDEDVSSFTEIASKSVEDSDGFLTDYTMYRDTETGEYVFVFGDKDAYSPEDGNFDWSCDTEEEAWDWFNSYYTGLDVDGDELPEEEEEAWDWYSYTGLDVDGDELLEGLDSTAKDVNSDKNIKYIKWVQLPNGKWKMWGSATTTEIDPEFLERVRKKTGIKYKDVKVSKNGEYPEDVEEKDIEKTHNLEEANYGGAFDIDPEQFFTREELVEFALLVIEHLNESYYTTFEIEDVFISNDNTLHLDLSDNEEGNIISASTKIDMRKIKNPQDLIKKYLYDVVDKLRKEYDEISSAEQMTESRDDNEELFEESDSEPAAEDNAEIILSSYNNYRLIEVTEDDEVYYIVMAPDGSVMTEDFYAWAEVEGLDFENLSTSDKVARFADYVDSIKQ